jgi:hypothetical protein
MPDNDDRFRGIINVPATRAHPPETICRQIFKLISTGYVNGCELRA